jgi:hypothetical protein
MRTRVELVQSFFGHSGPHPSDGVPEFCGAAGGVRTICLSKP